MVKVSIDNNVLAQILGIYSDYKAVLDSKKKISKNSRQYLNVRKSFKDKDVCALYDEINEGNIHVVLLPTVIKECLQIKHQVTEDDLKRSKKLFGFIKSFGVDIIEFTPEQQQQVDDLVNLFVFNSEGPIFKPNKNKNNKYNDAFIMAEAIVARTALITQDKHFSNVDKIKQYCIEYYGDKVKNKKYKPYLARLRPYKPEEYMLRYFGSCSAKLNTDEILFKEDFESRDDSEPNC